MNYLTNSFVFYIMRVVCSEGVLLTGSDMLDKAQIEKSVLYPAFLLLGNKKRLGGRKRYGSAYK